VLSQRAADDEQIQSDEILRKVRTRSTIGPPQSLLGIRDLKSPYINKPCTAT